jgi:hypothetical protein
MVTWSRHSTAENGRVAPEILLPQPVADDRRERFGPVAIFVASERAAQGWLYAQDVEVVSGDHFEPRGIGALQPIMAHDSTVWSFDVKALRAGVRVLRLRVGIRLKAGPRGEETKFYPLFERPVTVEVNPTYSVKVVASKKWEWIASTIIIPLIVFVFSGIWWKRREERRAEREKSRIISPADADIKRVLPPPLP